MLFRFRSTGVAQGSRTLLFALIALSALAFAAPSVRGSTSTDPNLKVAIIGAIIYLIIRIFSPETARRLRQKWNG